MARIKVTGYLDADDYTLDDGPLGPLSNESYEEIVGMGDYEGQGTRVGDLDDVKFELEED